MHGHSQLFTDPHLGRRGHQQGNGNAKRSERLPLSECFCLQEAQPLTPARPLAGFPSSVAAFQKINPSSELLEGQQRRRRREARPADGAGAGASRGSVHRHSHRHGFQRADVGGGEPSVRQKPDERRIRKGLGAVHPSEAGGQTVLQGGGDSWFYLY